MEDTDQLFDDYIEGKLSVDQISDFEKRLDKDLDFRKEFEAHKLVLGAVYAKKDKELLAELSTKKDAILKTWHYLSIAASISVIAIFIVVKPFATQEVLVSEGKGQMIAYEVTAKALGFTTTTDSLVMQLYHINGEDRYEFADTLKLYVTDDPAKLSIALKYYEDAQIYELTIDEERYELIKWKSALLK